MNTETNPQNMSKKMGFAAAIQATRYLESLEEETADS